MILMSLAAFCLSMTTWAALRGHLPLAITNATMMIMVPLLGGATFTMGEYGSNVGNIFFAAMMFGLSLQFLAHGPVAAHESINNTLLALVVVFTSLFLVDVFRPDPAFILPARLVGVSFVSFWTAQSLFIFLLQRYAFLPPMLCVPAMTIFIQVIDSAIFFPCAFAGLLPVEKILTFAITGWLVKSAIVLGSMPFLAVFLWRREWLAPA